MARLMRAPDPSGPATPSGSGGRWLDRAGRRHRLGAWAVVLAAMATTVYLSLAVAAYLAYPTTFSPWNNNWLSDLGNRELNPEGAIFYRLGCSVSGSLMIALFLSLAPWQVNAGRRERRLVVWAQAFGMFAGLAMVMTAVYPEDLFDTHQFWSRVLFSAFAGLLFVSTLAFRRPGRSNAPITFTAAVGYVVIALWLLFSDAHWLEWIAVADLLMFACLLGARTTTLSRESGPARGRPVGRANGTVGK